MKAEISAEEHADRVMRVRSVECPECDAKVGKRCSTPNGHSTQSFHHQVRWDAYYQQRGK